MNILDIFCFGEVFYFTPGPLDFNHHEPLILPAMWELFEILRILFREMFYLLGAAVPNFDQNHGCLVDDMDWHDCFLGKM